MDQALNNISILYRYCNMHIVRELKHIGISSGTYLLLLNLYENAGISQDRLTQMTAMDKSAVAKGITKLEEKGFVRHEPDATDGRVKRLYVTQKALDAHMEILGAVDRWKDIITQDMSPEEMREMKVLLGKMSRNASRYIQTEFLGK